MSVKNSHTLKRQLSVSSSIEGHSRGLRVLTPRPHDNIRRTRLRNLIPLIHLIARCRLLKESHRCTRNSTHIAFRIGRNDTEQPLPGLLGQIGLFEHTLGRVDVGEVESGARMAGVEDGGQTHTWLERFDHDVVH